MASTTLDPSCIAFGIELEMQLKPKDTPRLNALRLKWGWEQPLRDPAANKKKLRDVVSAMLTDDQIPTSTEKEWSTWTATEDPSLRNEPLGCCNVSKFFFSLSISMSLNFGRIFMLTITKTGLS